MQKDTFQKRLAEASRHAHELARTMVHNRLPQAFVYHVHLNQSYDGNPLASGESVFPDDVEKHGASVGPLAAEQVVELLWRDGAVPEWVDVSIADTDDRTSHIQLLCCGRFAERTELLYYSQADVSPFGIKSPYLPPDWKQGDGPFDLLWRKSRETRHAE